MSVSSISIGDPRAFIFFPKEDETLASTKSSSGAGGPDLQKAALGVEHAAPPAAAVSDTAKDMEQSQSKDSSSSKGGLQPDLTAAVVRMQATPSKGCTLHAYHVGLNVLLNC